MKRFVLFLCFLICHNCFSQTGYMKVIGRSADDIFNDMEELSDGGIMFGGKLQGEFNLTRCNSAADTIWTKQINPGVEITCFSILADNRIAMGGWGSGPSDDFAVVMIADSEGNILNTRNFYPDDAWGIWGYKVISTPDSGLIFIAYEDGYTCSNVFWMYRLDKNLQDVWSNGIGVCDADAFIADQLNPTSGLLQICRRSYYEFDSLGNEYEDVPKFRNLDLNNTYLLDSLMYIGKYITGVSGTADSSILGFGTQDTLGSIENYLTKINSDGSVAWERTFGTGYDDFPCRVVETADHGFAVLSTQRMPGNYNAPTVDVVFWKLDSNGQVQHHEIYGSTGNESGVKLIRKKDGSLLILGSTNGFGTRVNFVVQLDSMGYLNVPYTINSTAKHFCMGDTAVLTVLPAAQSYLWSTGETTQSIQVTSTGNFEVTVTDTSGTHSAPFYSVYFDSTPNATLQGTSQISICDGQTADLNVSYFPGYNYSWYRNGNLIDTVYLNALSTDTTGNYNVVVSNACGSDTSAIINVVDHPLPLQPVVLGYPSLQECGPIYLTDSIVRNDTLHWTWYQHDVAGDTLFLTQPDSYYLSVTATDANNCQSLVTSVVANVDIQPSVHFTNSAMNICIPGSTTVPFTASSNRGTFMLIRDGVESGPFQYIPSIYAYSGDTTICLIMSNQCGADTDTVTFTAVQRPQINFIPSNPIVCSGAQFILRTTATGLYQWDFSGQTFTDSVLTVTTAGYYTLQVTDSVSGCYSINSININTSTNSSPVTGLLSEYVLCPGDSVQLDPGSWSDYLWSSGSRDSVMVFNNYSGQADTSVYTITVIDTSNCVSTDTISIISDLCLGVNQLEDFSKIKLYPNPATRNLFIELPHFDIFENAEITIRNIPGEILLKQKISSDRTVIDVSAFPNGVYFISLESKKKMVVSRFNVIN